MINKPKHLSLTYAEQFKERSVVAAYKHRPPISALVFDQLLHLMVDEPRVVLDVGCGTGAIARPLAPRVDRVDAVDFSPAMIEAGRQLPNGAHPHLRWIEGSVEHAPLAPPYALIVAAHSLHWMDWSVVMPRFRSLLSNHGVVAIVAQEQTRQPWDSALLSDLIPRYSTNQDFVAYNLVDELTKRQLFRRQGEYATPPLPFQQSIADYVEAIHSRNGFSRERMTAANAQAFDHAVTQILTRAYPDGIVQIEVIDQIIWGQPGPIA